MRNKSKLHLRLFFTIFVTLQAANLSAAPARERFGHWTRLPEWISVPVDWLVNTLGDVLTLPNG